MKIGILGTGDVGKALGRGFLALGHDVRLGAREATNPKAAAFAEEAAGVQPVAGVAAAGRASTGTFADAARFGEVVVLATLGAANANVIAAAGPDNLAGKLLLDTTNPLDFSAGMPPRLSRAGDDSGGEEVQRLAPAARVVKVFNTVGNALMFRPELPGGPPDMFIAGDDAAAKRQTVELLRDFGWPVVHDLGGIVSSRYLEAMCLVWVLSAMSGNHWRQAFKLLRA